MKILLTGGAGYVGSHVLRLLEDAGHETVVLDNLSNGHREAIGEAELVEGDLLDVELLAKVFERDAFDCVMHFCGLIEAGESVSRPDKYYRVNVAAGVNLLDAMIASDVRRIVFSSTAALYGNPETLPITEDHPTVPLNPYGWSKLFFERMLRDFSDAFGLGVACLRYFNAAGAHASAEIGEAHRSESHLIPLVLRAAQKGAEFTIYGDDYDTADGTAVRDFVHIEDLARAHMMALEAIEPGEMKVWNVGSGSGYSVREVIETAKKVSGLDVAVKTGPRRPGDTPALVASSERIERDLGWKPLHTQIEDIVRSAWKWHSTHPDGYERESH